MTRCPADHPAGIVRRLFAAVLLVAALAADAASAVTATFDPSWEGRYLPGRASELQVHLVAATGGRFELALESRSGRTLYAGILEANNPQDLWLPLVPDPGGPVSITLSRDGKPILQRSLAFAPSPRPLTVFVQSFDPEKSVRAERHPLAASPALATTSGRLPRTGDGYRSVGTLVLSPEALTELDAMQLAALQDYLGDCGTLLLTRSAADLLRRLRGIAGCGGAFVGLADADDSSRWTSAPPRPPLKLLSGLDDGTTTDRIGFIAVFFAVYSVSLLLIAVARKRPAELVAVPLLATLALLVLWPLQDNPVRLASWAEMESGNANVRYSALLQIEGYTGNRYRRVSVSSRMGIPQREDAPPLSVRFDSLQPGVESLVGRVRPFSCHLYRFQGSLPAPLHVQLEVSAEVPKVTNLGAATTPAGLLGWSDRVYAVPSLPPGRAWVPSRPARIVAPSDLTQRLRQRAAAVKAALLLPMTLKDAGLIAPDSGLDRLEGWLLIRPSRGIS